MNRNTIVRIAFVLVGLVAVAPAASAVPFHLKSARYSTYVSRGQLNGQPFETRTNFAFAPIEDAYASTSFPGRLECEADATLLRISTLADAYQHQVYRGHSEARAGTDFVFTPNTDAFAAIKLDFFMAGAYAWGGNEFSLTDVTTGTTLWSFYDQGIGGGKIPWNYFAPGAEAGVTATLTLPTTLSAAHDYRIHMASWGSSSVPDSDYRTMQVSGLELAQVPEPTVGALSLLAAAGLFCRRKQS